MRLLLVFCVSLTLGCASLSTQSVQPLMAVAPGESGDLSVAGWSTSVECLELGERIVQARGRVMEDSVFLSTRRSASRRLSALEDRASRMGCLVPEASSY